MTSRGTPLVQSAQVDSACSPGEYENHKVAYSGELRDGSRRGRMHAAIDYWITESGSTQIRIFKFARTVNFRVDGG